MKLQTENFVCFYKAKGSQLKSTFGNEAKSLFGEEIYQLTEMVSALFEKIELHQTRCEGIRLKNSVNLDTKQE